MTNSPIWRPRRRSNCLPAAAALAASLLCGLGQPAVAEVDKPGWYQVEVILFANESWRWQQSELWRDKFEPVYPKNLVLLKPYREYEFQEFDTDFESLRRKMPDALEEIDSDFSALRREYLTPEQRAERELEEQLLEEQLESENFPAFGQPFPDPLAATRQQDEAQPEPPRLERPMDLDRDPFILLPEKLLQMQQTARRISSAEDMRLLAHLGWRQPLDSQARATPVLVQAGNQFDLDFELEGTLRASANRFLHLDSTLYFSRFQRNLIQETPNWSSFYDTPDDPSGGNSRGYGTALDSGQPGLFDSASDNFQRTLTAKASDSRRLRAGELHYIDHPLFGILVQMTPWELPDPVLKMKDFDLTTLPKKKPLPEATLAPRTPGDP